MIGGSTNMLSHLVTRAGAATTLVMLGLAAPAAANIAGVAGAAPTPLPVAPAAAAAALTVDKAATAWMLTSTILVLLMILPGLALFYGGLVRTKNMLSILSQVLGITAVAILVWVGWGYSVAFDAGSPYLGELESSCWPASPAIPPPRRSPMVSAYPNSCSPRFR